MATESSARRGKLRLPNRATAVVADAEGTPIFFVVRGRNSEIVELPDVESGATDRAYLVHLFLARVLTELRNVAVHMSTETLYHVSSDVEPLHGLARVLSEQALQPTEAATDTSDSVRSLSELALARAKLLDEAGGGWSAQQVEEAIGITRQAVEKRRNRQQLLAVQLGSGEWRYPAIQFREGHVVNGLGEVLAAFAVSNPWTRLSVLITPAAALDGRTPFDALWSGDVADVVAVVSSYGETGGA